MNDFLVVLELPAEVKVQLKVEHIENKSFTLVSGWTVLRVRACVGP
jgi:hypothetical protein